MTAYTFYMFSAVMLTGGIFTVVSRNPVHSVLWLICTFFSSACLFLMLGAEFVAMLLLIVYVGAVAVLFLFVVMMLDIDFEDLKVGMGRYIPATLLLGLVILLETGFVMGSWVISAGAPALRASETPTIEETENTIALGRIIYTRYVISFQAAGLILLTAMVGAIVLTLKRRSSVRRQDVLAQLYRDPVSSVDLKDVNSGSGVEQEV